MATQPIVIDPQTGERVEQSIQIDPNTGERISPPADSRNSVQRFLDESVTPPVGEKMDNSAQGLFNQAYYGVPQGLEHVVSHPLETLGGIGNALVHPWETAKQTVQNFASKPVLAVGQMLGAQAAMQPVADLAVAGSSALPKAASQAAPKLYGNALKPPTTLSSAERASMIKTGLDNSIPVSHAGIEKLGNLIDDLNDKINNEIQSDPNRPIDPNAVATRIQPTADRFANQVVAQPDLNAIEAQRQQFLAERGAHPAIPSQPTGILDAQGRPIMTPGTPAQPAPPMAAADAQAMKQGTYQVLKGKYGEQGSATVEAQKALARGLKEEIASQFPEINNLNQAESRLLDLGPALQRAVNRISNNHTIGIGGPIMAGGLKAATGSSGLAATLGVLKSVVDIPAVKSQLAIALSKGAKIPYSQALSRVSAYSTSLGSAALGSQAYPSADNSTPPER